MPVAAATSAATVDMVIWPEVAVNIEHTARIWVVQQVTDHTTAVTSQPHDKATAGAANHTTTDTLAHQSETETD